MSKCVCVCVPLYASTMGVTPFGQHGKHVLSEMRNGRKLLGAFALSQSYTTEKVGMKASPTMHYFHRHRIASTFRKEPSQISPLTHQSLSSKEVCSIHDAIGNLFPECVARVPSRVSVSLWGLES